MLLRQGFEIKRRCTDRGEGLAPDHAQHRRCDQAQGILSGLAGPDFTARLTLRDQVRQMAKDRGDGPLIPDAGQLWKVAGLSDHHLHDPTQRRGYGHIGHHRCHTSGQLGEGHFTQGHLLNSG